MKKRSRMIFLIALGVFAVYIAAVMIIYRPTRIEVVREKFAPNLEFALENWRDIGPDAIKATTSPFVGGQASAGGSIFLAQGDVLTVDFDLPRAGEYKLALHFTPAEENLNMFLYTIGHSGGLRVTQLFPVWTDADTFFILDRRGFEFAPRQKMVLMPTLDYLRDYESINNGPIIYYFEAGETTLTITGNQPIYVHDIYAVPMSAPPAYGEYIAEMERANGNKAGTDLVIIEAEDLSIKSESYINYLRQSHPALPPFDTFRHTVVGLSGHTWFVTGQKVLWEFEINDPGFYHIAFRYAIEADDNVKGGKSSFRDIEINGRPLFSEMNGYLFPFTGGAYPDHTMHADGEDFRIWLDAGRHTISMSATTGAGEEIADEIQNLIDSINSIGMDLKKISAGTRDMNRTWDMNAYLPDAIPSLTRYADVIDGLYARIEDYNQFEATFANGLIYTQRSMRRLLEDHRRLPNRTDILMEGNSSVSAMLGEIIAQITRQPIHLNRIYIYGENQPPDMSASFSRLFAENLHNLVRSFSPEAIRHSNHSTFDPDGERLNVWLTSNQQNTEIARQLTDLYFESDMDVSVTMMIDINMLILSNASGNNPDVVIGIDYPQISDFSIRGAAKNLLEFEEFLPFYSTHYGLESLVPVSFNGKVFGAVDSMSMTLMYYRTDIMESLGLEVPDTWDEVAAILPTLTRYSMNFNTHIANAVAKTIDMTGPFFFQNDNNLYTQDGQNTTIGTVSGVEAFQRMTDLYRIYGASRSVANFFNSFRYGEVPIGVGELHTYFLLLLSAPELAGKWEIALIPGTREEDGTINRSYPAAMRACMIFENTKHPQESFDFLKWWLSTETQVNFPVFLRATYGPQYYWITANNDAMRQLPFAPGHMEIIMEQRSHQKEAFRHMAWYMLERTLSNAWHNVVENDRNAIVSINQATLETDREIRRKLVEFGYMDEQGNVLEEFITDTVDRLREKLEGA